MKFKKLPKFIKMETGLHIIIGPMFSGKTTELCRELCRAREVDFRVLYVNHSFDTRNEKVDISTHNPMLTSLEDAGVDVLKVEKLEEVHLEVWNGYDIIGIDEAQFFDNLEPIVLQLVDDMDKRVYVCGLDGTFQQKKFGRVLDLIPHSDSVQKLPAWCKMCKVAKKVVPAIFTHRLSASDKSEILVGGKDSYTALCRKCFNRVNNNLDF